ncbi:PEPxxWA-CTERM sorting domain-containing protein [Methyloversatilis thermotolerans]|uniref:PEPxxWA-CTERM sorting domain-containing protein n=1 Tax=Methyloversatilis thermotolerans TaxID=1346290 RepID=UPI001E2F01E3|nr:PEPxxWA-CTERM sorting domain-containing protein [Methyloversatilis thermotolerans]
MSLLSHRFRGMFLGLALSGVSSVALGQSIHFDVTISLDKGPVVGSKLVAGAFGDLPFATLPTDYETGAFVFPGNFGDFEGGPRATDDPGFQAFAGALKGGSRASERDLIGFRAVGILQYWDPVSGVWSDADAGVGVRLYGAVPPAVADAYLLYQLSPSLAPPNAVANYQYYESGTLFTGEGISGPAMAVIDDASSSGAFHAHLDWFIEGNAPVGAYMVTLQLTDSTTIGGKGRYVDSDPFQVLFNYGLDSASYQAAFQSRLSAPVPEPATWAFLLAGFAALSIAARRRPG